jgi:hypothetical protein
VSLFEAKAQAANLPNPDYWEPFNEPDDLADPNGYLASGQDANSATVNNVDLAFQHVWCDIKGGTTDPSCPDPTWKGADPNAQMLGPSLNGFAGFVGQRSQPTATCPTASNPQPCRLDLATFLNFSANNALKWDAISWHENVSQQTTDFTDDPEEDVANHVAVARALLAQNSTLGSPKIAINEYGPPDRWVVPGWQAGNIAAMEAAGVDFASHTCDSTGNVFGPSPSANNNPGLNFTSNCFAQPSTLDGLVGTNGSDKYSSYLVGAEYAAMTYDTTRAVRSSVVSSSSSSANIGVFATREDATSTVSALIGRNETCLGGQTGGNADCGSSANPPAGQDVPIAVTFPYAAPHGVQVMLERIPFPAQNAFNPPDTFVPGTLTQANGQWVTTVRQLQDGEAVKLIFSALP